MNPMGAKKHFFVDKGRNEAKKAHNTEEKITWTLGLDCITKGNEHKELCLVSVVFVNFVCIVHVFVHLLEFYGSFKAF